MRTEPTWRIPIGVLALFVALIAYAILAVWLVEPISSLPVWLQTIAYLILGIAWLLPLRRFLIWMETGSWSPPDADHQDADSMNS